MSDSLWSMDCSTPGFPVHRQFLVPAQTPVHRVGNVIQPSHPLSSPSPPAFNLSQHRGLFQWVSSWYQVAKLLELQHQSFQWIFRTDFLWDWLVWSLCSPRDSGRFRFFLIWVITKYWVEFPVTYSRSLLVISPVYSSVCVCVCVCVHPRLLIYLS